MQERRDAEQEELRKGVKKKSRDSRKEGILERMVSGKNVFRKGWIQERMDSIKE